MNVNPSKPTSGTLWLAGVVFVVTVAAYVYLVDNGHDTVGLIALTGPVLGALFVVDSLGRQVRQQTTRIQEQVEEVKQQTNGVLDERIHTVTTRAIAESLPMMLATAYATQPTGHQAPPSTSTLPADFRPQPGEHTPRHGGGTE